MKALITMFAILTTASIMNACGGKTETKQNETKTSPTVSAVSTATPMGNNMAVSKDGDRDDIKSPIANNTNAATTKTGDRDDVIAPSKSANTKPSKKTGDNDDRGKKDSDGDDEDR